jgi:hypothetical protein
MLQAPPLQVSDKPGGRKPEANDHEYGAVPFCADKGIAYAWFTAPPGSGDGVVIERAGATVRLNCFVAVAAAASVTVAVNVNSPAMAGVPLTVPAALRVTPEGRPNGLGVQEYEVPGNGVPPVAANVC